MTASSLSHPATFRPATVPLCAPADTIELIGSLRRGTGRDADREVWVYVVVHRSHGLWTHLYDVVESPGRSRSEIRLIRIMAGDRLAEARAWALKRFPIRLHGYDGVTSGWTG
jgi:hypothetical protein